MRRLCLVLLAANLAYCAAAAWSGALPGWAMFVAVEPLPVLSSRGEPIDPLRYAPRGHYIVNRVQLRQLAGFLCRARPELKPLTLEGGDPCAR